VVIKSNLSKLMAQNAMVLHLAKLNSLSLYHAQNKTLSEASTISLAWAEVMQLSVFQAC